MCEGGCKDCKCHEGGCAKCRENKRRQQYNSLSDNHYKSEVGVKKEFFQAAGKL